MNILERHGSSPADAAVYLLGTTLESYGESGGEEDIQLWTLVVLLKVMESSAVIFFTGRTSVGCCCIFWIHFVIEIIAAGVTIFLEDFILI